jgi:ABC-2 type transport system ATP-binding protein
MLQARALRKRYGAYLAVDSVTFDVHPGEILGYIGPNGSGKSTTVNMVVGLLEPTAGSVSLNGRSLADDPLEYKRRVGYVPEEPYLYTHLTAGEYLTLVGRLRGIDERPLAEKIERLLKLFLLFDSRYSAMSAFSKGMRQRVLLAGALLHDPELIVLDEPFSGLDVTAGLLFRALLQLLAADGKMVLFSSHRFDVVQQVCARTLILSRGRIVCEHRLARDEAGESLEQVFARVTEQQDYTALAREVLAVIRG